MSALSGFEVFRRPVRRYGPKPGPASLTIATKTIGLTATAMAMLPEGTEHVVLLSEGMPVRRVGVAPAAPDTPDAQRYRLRQNGTGGQISASAFVRWRGVPTGRFEVTEEDGAVIAVVRP